MSKKIGILGGSFNPAHEGHVHISLKALDLLGLDEVWWLVSPQNPLKPIEGMADFEERFAGAENITKNQPNIIVSDLEQIFCTNKTYDTLAALKEAYPDDKFVWLMGADNLAECHKWHRWQEFFALMPIAVFDRGDYAGEALRSEAAKLFASSRITEDHRQLAERKPPAWCFLEIEKHPASGTEIREES